MQLLLTRRRVALTAIGALIGGSRAAGSSEPVRLIRVPNGGIQPQVACGEDGTIHLVYYGGDARAGELFYARSKDNGQTWPAPLRVNAPGSAIAAGTIRGAQLALGASGRVHVAWNGSGSAQLRGPINPDSGKPGAPMLYTRINDSGDGFEPERNLMHESFGLDGGGSIAADRRGNVYVAWHGIGIEEAGQGKGEARRQVWIAKSEDHGRTFSRERKAWHERTGACACCGMELFAGRDGSVNALYRSARESTHRDIYLLRSTDRAVHFTGNLLHRWDINACPMSSMDFTERRGSVIAAWETEGQVYWADAGAGDAKPIPAPGVGKGRKHPRIATNSKGELLFVWTEGTGWQRGGSLAWQHYDPSGQPTTASGTTAGVPVWSFATPVAHPDGAFSIFA